jgi:uncharacterized protein YjcR
VKDPKDLAYQDYLNGMKYKDIAEKYNVTLNTVKSWKTRYKWSRDGVHTKEKSVHTKKKDAPKENKRKRSGNPHPSQKFPERNTFALKHGLFSRYIPKETLEIMGMMDKAEPADLIWDQIQIQYAAIIRAQHIMFVNNLDRNDPDYDFDAFDKQVAFLTAQSRAMGEFRSLVKQFNEMAHEDDERRLRLEQLQLGIDKTKAEINKLNGIDDEATVNGLDQLAEAIRKSASALKGDS